MRIRAKRCVAAWAALACGMAMAACAAPPASPADEDKNPEGSSGYAEKPLVRAERFMVASANPLASEAGYDMLRQGGSAIDAAIATQLVLNLTEPQSSGIGGGAFIVYYDSATQQLKVYDGRETAPSSAQPARFMRDGRTLSYGAAVNSGLSVGVPGVLRAMELAHKRQGKLPWSELFKPAIRLAEQGFRVSPRLHKLVSENKALASQGAAAAYFLDERGRPWPVGHVLKNPDFAEVLRRVAKQGADAFYTGAIARGIVAAVRAHETPGDMTLADLSRYRAKEREPLCGTYRLYRVCGVPPPSAGVLGVLQMLGMLEQFPMSQFAPLGLEAVHYFSEAGRLAYADRDFYVADPDFVDVPAKALIDPAYLQARAALIDPDRSMGVAPPGDPVSRLASLGRDNALEIPSTSHIVVVDAEGDMLSMTTTIESAFGSKIFVHGFLLNNQLTDFSHNPVDAQGRLVANRVEGGKRPRSTMAPIIVFRDAKPYMAIGSPGGSAIMNYVAQTLVGVIDWKLDIQQAVSLPHYGSRNKQTELERGTPLEKLAQPLRAMGHDVSVHEFPSGLQGIVIDEHGLSGGADPRREGKVLGD
ncbi:gamma-glutamyltransferase [Pusillimonas caeni]|uniref:gamma-glutamyltransferase n=1 Tax=Pusillimonas caeni TaxID=1348472 RepID=UPI003CC9138B